MHEALRLPLLALVDGARMADLGYLAAAVLFILGIKGMTHPRTAVRGNLLGSIGMLIAVVMTVLKVKVGLPVVLFGLVIGGLIGAYLAVSVLMTQMPQFVALFNGLGGAASVLVAAAEVLKGFGTSISTKVDPTAAVLAAEVIKEPSGQVDPTVAAVAAAATAIIGAVTFTGSMIACGKLQEWEPFKKPFAFPGQQAINALLLLVALALSAWLVGTVGFWPFLLVAIVAGVLGVFLVTPIGGADMPVVIALLNSYSGLAAAATGFVIGNNVLIIAGSLVGASGIILTRIMCKAMNRSLLSVLFGGELSAAGTSASADEVYGGRIKSTTPDEVAMMLDGVQRVVIVPGYGLAVSQAQHAVRDLATILESRGTTVQYAIHPVAGRMPGHMNVLLAEADVPYDQLKEMDEINPTFAQCDVAIVIGANDVVNPIARTDPASPIAGMPILDVDKARTVIVVKRSLSPGFAGIPNPLFAADNCLMLFADGKQAILDLVGALKEH